MSLKDLMSKYEIDTGAKVLDVANSVDTVREQMCKKIDRHIERYVKGNVEITTNKSGKSVKKKVDCLHKATDKANMRAIFLKYGNTHIPIYGQEYIPVKDKQEEALWNDIKDRIKAGEFDSELTEASRKSSEKLISARAKKAKKK
jgi:hypothetical protein